MDTPGQVSDRLTEWARHEKHAYAGDAQRPLGSLLLITAGYETLVTGLAGLVWMSGRPLPERIAAGDLALMTVATHKLARLLAKAPVTSPLRAPFTRFAGTSGEAELAEQVRGVGARKALGELVTCPFCLGQWVATGLTFGFVLAPRATRLAASAFAALAGSDLLQLLYTKTEAWATG